MLYQTLTNIDLLRSSLDRGLQFHGNSHLYLL